MLFVLNVGWFIVGRMTHLGNLSALVMAGYGMTSAVLQCFVAFVNLWPTYCTSMTYILLAINMLKKHLHGVSVLFFMR